VRALHPADGISKISDQQVRDILGTWLSLQQLLQPQTGDLGSDSYDFRSGRAEVNGSDVMY
jgi:hypothetical protein